MIQLKIPTTKTEQSIPGTQKISNELSKQVVNLVRQHISKGTAIPISLQQPTVAIWIDSSLGPTK